MAVVAQSAARVYGRSSARQGHETLLQGLPVRTTHQRQFSSCRGINDFRISTGVVLFNGAVERIKGQSDSVNRNRISIGIPCVGMIAVVGHIPVVVVGGRKVPRKRCHAVCGR